MGGHVIYSQFIAKEKKLPEPYQSWQAYQPPAYYLINQLFSPLSKYHISKVRICSIFYGLIFLVSCHIIMTHWNISKSIQLFVLIYFMSIPAVVHLFTTYNNDSLAMGLSASIIATCIQYFYKPRFYVLIILFILAAFGIYTKYNLVLLFFTIGVVLCGAVLFRAIKIKMALKIV
jgi:4-amino-4-deoxy-L-arabinose transferase-like glycosyltransferase